MLAIPHTRIHLALTFAAVLAAAPLRAQTEAVRPFDGGTFVIDLPAALPAMQGVRMEMDGDTVEGFISSEEVVVMVFHFGAPSPVDTTLSARRAVLQGIRAGMARLPGNLSVAGDAREIVTDERLTLRTAVIERTSTGTRHGIADVSVPRHGGGEMWMVIYLGPAPGPAPGPALEAAAARVLDSFRLAGGRSPIANAPVLGLTDAAIRGAVEMPAPTAAATAAGRLRNMGRFSIDFPQGYQGPLARTGGQGVNLTDAYIGGTEKTTATVVTIQPRQQPATFHPTTDGLRAIARQALAEMSRAQGDTRIGGPAREILRPDRFTLRVPATNTRFGQAGTADISVRREGRMEIWTVVYLSEERGPAVDAAAARVLDSFRLTDRPRVAATADTRDLLAWIGGRWGWSHRAEPCDSAAATVAVAADRRSVRMEAGISAAASDRDGGAPLVYTVVASGSGYLRGRLAPEGVPTMDEQFWDVVRLSRDAFCWHRVDWDPGMCTAPLQRCPAAPPSGSQALLPSSDMLDAGSRQRGR